MIECGSLKQQTIETIKQIHALKCVSVGAKLLACSVFLKHENWKVSWAFFARELNVDKSSISRWKNELVKAKIWEIKESINDKNKPEIVIKFIGDILQQSDILQPNKNENLMNFIHQKENSIRAHDAHARGENLSDENSQNFTQMQNSTFAENATLQSENENFKADLNALNSNEIQANLSQNEQEKANLQGLNFVGEFSPNFANERSQNGVKTESVGHCENDEFSNKAQNADLVAMSENENEQKATQNAKYKGILEKFAGVIKGTATQMSAKPKGTATQMSEYLKTQKRQNKAEKKQSARAMRLREADEVFSERESEIKCFSKDDWDGWVEHKLARAGVHFTKQTWKNDIQKLIEASSGAKAMINHSIACAYQGLFAPRASGGGQMSEWQKQRQAQNEMLADW